MKYQIKLATKIFLFALTLSSSIAMAAVLGRNPVAPAPLVSFAQLKDFVRAKGITTIDALIPQLPQQMLQNSMLVYDSKALNRQLISPETPRIVLFNADASLILAVTKNPGGDRINAGLDTLEVIEFDAKSKKFVMHNVAFDGRPGVFDRAGAPNPALCLSCHGSNPRPMFQDYNAWPGFYGSFSQKGVAVRGTMEFTYLTRFLNVGRTQSRYNALQLNFVAGEHGIYNPSVGFGPIYDQYKFSPLLAFGAAVEFRMYERLARKLELSPSIRNYLGLIGYLGRADECGAKEDAHRAAIREIFTEWLRLAPANSQRLSQMRAMIENQVKIDLKAKADQFGKFNAVVKDLDPRGVMNVPYETFVLGAMVGTPVDKEAFLAQMLILESMSTDLMLNTEDFSTVLGRPTSGIFHIRKLGLLEDEQLFKAILEGLVQIRSPIARQIQTASCQNLKAQALLDLRNLKFSQVPASLRVF